MRERYGHTHPMPGILLVIGCFVPVCHEKQGLDEYETVALVVKVVQKLRTSVSLYPSYTDCTCEASYPRLLEEGFARRFPTGIASLLQKLDVHVCRTGKHDSVVQE